MLHVNEGDIEQAMKLAESCAAWPVAIKLAKILGDNNAAARFAENLVQRIQWHIPLIERTPARLNQELKKILSEY